MDKYREEEQWLVHTSYNVRPVSSTQFHMKKLNHVSEKVSVNLLRSLCLQSVQDRFDVSLQESSELGIVCKMDGTLIREVLNTPFNFNCLTQINQVCLEDFVDGMWRETFLSVDWEYLCFGSTSPQF